MSKNTEIKRSNINKQDDIFNKITDQEIQQHLQTLLQDPKNSDIQHLMNLLKEGNNVGSLKNQYDDLVLKIKKSEKDKELLAEQEKVMAREEKNQKEQDNFVLSQEDVNKIISPVLENFSTQTPSIGENELVSFDDFNDKTLADL